jgi:hypothetical protein
MKETFLRFLEECQQQCLVLSVNEGVFFNFDISAMLVKYQEHRKPFTHFLTDICAIVGGVFTVAGIIDGILFSAGRNLSKKDDLGKQT